MSLNDNERAMTPHHRYELLIKITDKSLGLINTGSIFACTSFKEDKSSSNISVSFSKGIPNVSVNKEIDYISQIFLINDELNMKYLSQVPRTKEIKIKEQMGSRGVVLSEDKWNNLLYVLDEDKKVAMDMMGKIVGI